MKRLFFPVLVLVTGLACSSNSSDLTKDERQKMDKLFREGVKHPTNAPPGTRGSEGTPLNAADK